ncbi:ABC transporter substrate-binding protein [Streptomyces sp. SID13031]|uniref:ABC transporter substrate-binding protein n=1 Tax=Streptomyces sp. SID13031 TaxID=2706046 RepID=UPI0013CB2BA5|nr:ABC transporter substrate-binding protein [Streptomyces sp. SID13031]NEA33962.1 ABC transporter substrate-binding protein [Streptomyces sp. SID13031]
MPRIQPVKALGAAAVIALLATACTGTSSGPKANDDAAKDTTITFWYGWSAPSEVAAIDANIKAFEAAHPNIHVKAVGNINDDKIKQALRAGGPNAPDVVSSFSSANVGAFCKSNVLADLEPFLDKSGVDLDKTFPKAVQGYTQYQGKRCTLPLLADTYGLHYNKDAFKAAGITSPPKTFSEFEADAKKLTKPTADGYSQLGFMPNYHGYTSTLLLYGYQWGLKYFDEQGKANASRDPKVTQLFTTQKRLVDELGGYAKLEKYRTTFGDQYGAKNPLHTGQVAMTIDGEWRAGMAKEAGIKFELGVAPLPVPDDQAASYGRGGLSGTIIGIASTSEKQNAAWELVKFMTTDTDAVVSFANAIHNVPSTLEALKSPKLTKDPLMAVFTEIAQNKDSISPPSTPNGDAYMLTLQDVGYRYESGRLTDLPAALKKADEQIDKDIAQVK